ncbi:SseB family protein [Microbacterium sp. P04]|uniref:SseB family protein n=1 Tax=Microbacterium sp. P04 TaxID=3366947 RepID=UPI003744C186
MALFSRRKKTPDSTDTSAGRGPDESDAATPSDAPSPEPPATVGISTSTFRGVGASAAEPPVPAPQAPVAEAETIPGVRDNVLLRDALAELSDPPTPQGLLNVARQLLQGPLFLRVKGNARALLAEGRGLPLAVTRRGDKQLVLAYSSGAALQAAVSADGEADTSAVGQPVLTVLRLVLDGEYEGLILDNSSGTARALLPRPLLQRVVDDAHAALALKSLLAGVRTEDTPAAVAAALGEAPLWIAIRRTEEGGPVGIAESRTADGDRFIEVFSHPLEVLALGRGDQPLPVTLDQLRAAVTADAGITGLLIDPGGPWLRLHRDHVTGPA